MDKPKPYTKKQAARDAAMGYCDHESLIATVEERDALRAEIDGLRADANLVLGVDPGSLNRRVVDLTARAEKAEANLASSEAAFARWKAETAKDVAALDALNALVKELREALLGVRSLSINNEPCWCDDPMVGLEHLDQCIEARIALAKAGGGE